MAKMKSGGPKIREFLQWPKIREVNKMLDSGVTPNQVWRWVERQKFPISSTTFFQYCKERRAAMIEGAEYESLVNSYLIRTPIIVNMDPARMSDTDNNFRDESFREKSYQIKSELELLDEIIYMGQATLEDMKRKGRHISIGTALKAIELKNKITEKGHMNLTSYGFEELKRIEQAKFQAVLSTIIQYVPPEKRGSLIDAIEQAEEDFYKKTEYYDEYRRAKIRGV